MSRHVEPLLPLAAAGVLGPEEQAQVSGHLRACPECAQAARAWDELAARLRRLPATPPSAAVLARTRLAVAERLAEERERSWNRAALGFLIAFAWTLAWVAWLVLDLATGNLELWLGRPVGSSLLWLAAYLVGGWLAGGAAAVMLGRRAQAEWRT